MTVEERVEVSMPLARQCANGWVYDPAAAYSDALLGLWKAAQWWEARGEPEMYWRAYAWSRMRSEIIDGWRRLYGRKGQARRFYRPSELSFDDPSVDALGIVDAVDPEREALSWVAIVECLRRLRPQQARVLFSYYILDQFQGEIAAAEGVSEVRISQIRRLALREAA